MGTFRSTALPPIYPLASLGDAFTRLYFLEKHIRAADRMLARHYTVAIEEMRVRLEREFDATYAAVETITEHLPRLLRCACGKISHATEESAGRQLAALFIVNKDPSRIEAERLNVYACPVARRLGREVWHTGHRAVGTP